MKKITLLIALTVVNMTLFAQKGGESIIKELEKNKEAYGVIAQQIWDYAEMGYLEEQSTALLQKTLSDEGFSVENGVAGIPTAFIAEYGSGAPVLALLGEFDALPVLSQERVPEKKSAGSLQCAGRCIPPMFRLRNPVGLAGWMALTNCWPAAVSRVTVPLSFVMTGGCNIHCTAESPISPPIW